MPDLKPHRWLEESVCPGCCGKPNEAKELLRVRPSNLG